MAGLKMLSVHARIGILGGLIAFTLIALAGTIFYSDRATSAALERRENFAEIERLSLEVQVAALEMRRREKDFLLRRETRYLDAYNEDAARLESLLTQIEALDAPEEINAAITHLQELLPQHQAVFNTVVETERTLGLTHEEGLQGTLRSAVHNVEERLADFQDDGLTVLMLMMRRHEKDFMLRGEARYIDRLDQRQVEFDAMLAERGYPAADVAEIRALMAAYGRDFHAWAEQSLAQQETVAELSAVFAEMEPDFEIIFERAGIEGRAAVEALHDDRETIRYVALGIVVAIAIIAGLLCWLIGRSIAGPVSRLTQAMDELADGRTDGVIPATEEGGEIGRMAGAVQVFQKNQIEMERMREEQARAEERAAEEKRRMMSEMADEFDASVGGIARDVAEAAQSMIAIADNMRMAAGRSGERTTIAASAAEETSTNTQAVSAAAEELTTSIREINRQVDESRKLTGAAVTEAGSTRDTVAGLGEAVIKIGDVVTLIQSIAEQTNLLALNATIEASRAGDAGKGFAVVASEVKALADQTGKATQDIADQIEAMQKSGDSAVTAIESMTQTIDRVSESTTAIAGAIEQQDAAAREIAGSVSQAAEGTAQVTESMAALTGEVHETDEGAGRVLEAAQGVASDAERLRDTLAGFLQQIRAA